MSWRPTTADELTRLLAAEVADCSPQDLDDWAKYSVPPYQAPIERYGKAESVFVVARRGNEVMYWEDIEEGFNVSPVDASGKILEHWCNQDKLRWALARWR